jgi:hypothetical protein
LNILLSKNQRDREAAVARAMATALCENLQFINSEQDVSLPVLAEHFGRACQLLNFVPDDASMRRIFQLVSGELNERRQTAERLATLVKDVDRVSTITPTSVGKNGNADR